ncbi:MAG: DUF4444 domain-containing protein [Rhodobacteraceae bacterium]|nr:DUF4444 domain-containing protein [Paracoccaceae bacterium]
MSEVSAPSFPPLFTGHAITGRAAPFVKACTQAMLGCDSGLIVYNLAHDRLRFAVVLTPEVPLERAMAVFCICGVGFQNALGALAPPEVAVHLEWDGGILVNGASCGRLQIAASTTDPAAVPDWLVVGLDVPLIPPSEASPGKNPNQTSLFEEGCVEVEPVRLLESWARHTLVWINEWSDNDASSLHAEWCGLAHGIGEDYSTNWRGETLRGKFLGVDEHFGLLLRSDDDTHLLPLSGLLEKGGQS